MYTNIPIQQPKSFLDAFNEVGSVANALTKGQLDNQIQKVAARYAPYTQYADALSKIAYANYLPYQIQSQILSNPSLLMSLKDNPEALANLAKSFSSNLPSVNQIAGGGILPTPDQVMGGGGGGGFRNPFHMGGGAPAQNNVAANAFAGNSGGKKNETGLNENQLNTIKEFMGNNANIPTNIPNEPRPAQEVIGGQGGNALNAPATQPQQPNNQSGLLPVSQGPLGWVYNMMAQNQSTPYKPGALIQNPKTGEITSVPTETMVNKSQNAISAAKRIEPALQEISDLAAPFLTAKGKWNLYKDKYNNFLRGGESDVPSDYAYFRAKLANLPEQLIGLFQINPNEYAMRKMSEFSEPHIGETPKSYKNRIIKQTIDLKKEQEEQAIKQLKEGFNVGNNNAPPQNAQETRVINGVQYHKVNGEWYHD